MPLPKGTKFPADPKERLDAILKDCFGNSRLALASCQRQPRIGQ
jgi:hypothetical protein